MLKWSFLYLVSEWVIRIIMLFCVPPQRTAAAARTWLLFIFLLPWPGLCVYLVFGRIYLPRRRRELQRFASQRIREIQLNAVTAPQSPLVPAYLSPAVTLATKLGDFQLTSGNSIELLPEYEEAIDQLIADIKHARHHVHLLYYIFENDTTGQRVANALVAASLRGIRCRVLVDAVGSRNGLRRLGPLLRENSVEVVATLPVGFFRRNAARFDLRNHRKIAVIDGQIGHVGSQNIVNPGFVPDHPNEELVARVTGPVVAQLQAVFLTDYYTETGRLIGGPDLFPPLPTPGSTPAQLLPSGPGFLRENQQELIIALLHAAQQRVVLVTPYFVPDEPFLQAIRTASDRGVEIHLVLSLHSNQKVTQLAQKSYYDELLEAGVHLYLYRPRFLHAKHLTIDHSVAIIGSTNIDIRSFALNAEVSMLFYDPSVVEQLRLLQEKYFTNSERVSRENWSKRALFSRALQGIARLMDSLL